MAYKLRNTKTAKRRSSRTLKNRTHKKRGHKKRTLVKRKQNKKSRKSKTMKNRKQYGGNFNKVELEKLNKVLKDTNLLNDEEILQMIAKLNMSSQLQSGHLFEDLIEQLESGTFTSKEELMEWIIGMGDEFEEHVATDDEYYDSDDSLHDEHV